MNQERKIRHIYSAVPTIEGAGVHLIGDPIAWYGPIVMNTEEELAVAFKEYRNGTFIKE